MPADRDPSRRQLLKLAALGALAPSLAAAEIPEPVRALTDATAGVQPIPLEAHRARLARAQRLLSELGHHALLLGPGVSLEYFTGARWSVSERFFGAVVGRAGDPVWVTPAFEKDRALQQTRIGGDVRAWQEHESPYALLAGILRDLKASVVAVDGALPFVFADGLASALPSARLVSGTDVVAALRSVKDAPELALLRRANEITVRAHRAVLQSLRQGMTQKEAQGLSREAHQRLGVTGGALILFGPDAAYPHGTAAPRPLRAGDLVIVDGGGKLHGYTSDITRTAVFGAAPTDRQRRLWDVVRRAQSSAFAAVRPGVTAESVDAVARAVIDDAGFGPDYRLFTHRLGHGIGMEGHEWPYLVRGNTEKLRPGMTFSVEPGIYIQGEGGVRHEDIVVVTEDGAENLTKWTGPPEDPAVV
jgi:Xaa-Pro dipeptidase